MNTSFNGNSLFDKWNQFAVKIIPFMVSGIKDGNSKVILQRLLEVQETDLGNILFHLIAITNIDDSIYQIKLKKYK
jgi:hypothetical protein